MSYNADQDTDVFVSCFYKTAEPPVSHRASDPRHSITHVRLFGLLCWQFRPRLKLLLNCGTLCCRLSPVWHYGRYRNLEWYENLIFLLTLKSFAQLLDILDINLSFILCAAGEFGRYWRGGYRQGQPRLGVAFLLHTGGLRQDPEFDFGGEQDMCGGPAWLSSAREQCRIQQCNCFYPLSRATSSP